LCQSREKDALLVWERVKLTYRFTTGRRHANVAMARGQYLWLRAFVQYAKDVGTLEKYLLGFLIPDLQHADTVMAQERLQKRNNVIRPPRKGGLITLFLYIKQGKAKTFTMANIIEKTQRTTFVLAHNKTLARTTILRIQRILSRKSRRVFYVILHQTLKKPDF